jgi:hypothetical protein
MLALCPELLVNPLKIDDTDPPTPTFSPTEDHGGKNRPRSLWESPPFEAMV